MNRFLPLFLTLFLLCGCAAQSSEYPTAEAPLSPPPPDNTVPGFYDAGSTLEVQSQGALLSFPLVGKAVTGFLALEDSLLLFSDWNGGTQLTVLSGKSLVPGDSLHVDCSILPENVSVNPHSNTVSYYHPGRQQIILLSYNLQETGTVSVPADITGSPVLSQDAATLYYCTTSAVRALELSSGLSRVLKEISYPQKSAAALLLEDSVLQVQTTDSNGRLRNLFLSTQTGQLLAQPQGEIRISSCGDFFSGHISESGNTVMVFGNAGDTPQLLHPRHTDICRFLPERRQAFTAYREGNQTALDCYDLRSGLCTASILLNQPLSPVCISATSDGRIWFLSESTEYGHTALYCWDPLLSPTEDSTLYVGEYDAQSNPEGLDACARYAQQLSQQFGIDILIGSDAGSLAPPEYDLECTDSVPVLNRVLSRMETCLTQYPQEMLQELTARFPGIQIGITAGITGSPESGNTGSRSSLLFWENYTPCILLTAGQNTNRSLHRELYHLIDSVVLTESTAYDQWDNMNPSDFRYDYSYSLNKDRDGSPWLQPGKESFVDTDSMSFPKEDRSRIMEYAMTPGQEDLFRSPYLQAKLRQICLGIREAFGFSGDTQSFLWEQYLQSSLT